MRAETGILSAEETAFLTRQRVARLATADADGAPHAIPVCFAYDGRTLYVALDEKPKDVPVTRLKRVRNILENPRVALVTDRYAEDWSILAYVMVRGRAALIEPGTGEHAAAVRLLRGKYHQYEAMRIQDNPVISIRPERAASWGTLEAPKGAAEPLLDALRGRRSVRRYLEQEVPGDAIEAVVEAARWAPSPHGTQPWRFAVVTKRETKARLADAMGEEWRRNLEMDGQDAAIVEKRLEGSHARLLDAPVLLLICLYPGDLQTYPDPDRQRNETTMAVQSLGAAAQNALLAAYEQGLDAGWMCAPLFCPGEVTAALGLDQRLVPHALLTLGYAAGDPPKRRPHRPLDGLVAYRD
ncbi:MAG: Coenzyme F420-0:L-glutamate ligase @ F420-1:L-glutamate ligase / Nitroreductase family protein Rcas_3978 [uncultured Rubrobacteraceae bacterium]|uniref:Coenzyme F420-0:L-glutamate ligase @ F420-1:L-glutamate ligase / Nitroreductase family protein Rcas_3978 n=1 Tax=uncultured Rubrobacteraceae bacterium TaxID=349277 RepID=A0A6J4RDB2_9ACTN|nr:MAG: Coenzyme F420-0:L-glutamate ligase @ F420-1:L-glutamate ligase / Nitroreductase family protein Rcas_3978 [uncultured Rubrobacteraceae bacterium]